jgi:hypothetical protein
MKTTVDDMLIKTFKREDEGRVKELEAKIDKLEAKLRRRPVPKDDTTLELAKLLDVKPDSERVLSEIKELLALRERVNDLLDEKDPEEIMDKVKALQWFESEIVNRIGKDIEHEDSDELVEKLEEIIGNRNEVEGLLDSVKDLHEFIEKHISRGEIRFDDQTLDILFERLMLAARKAYG